MSQPQDPPIVISGGSVTIEFNEFDFQHDQKHKFSNPTKRIQRVVIRGEGVEDMVATIPNGKCTIMIFYGNP